MPSALYYRLLEEAGPCCGYCRTCALVIGQPLTIEHIIAIAKGGTSDILNLWLSCRRCNQFKGVQIEAVDPESGIVTPLFNPRTQRWQEHFAWSADATQIIGLSPIGRATVVALRLNNDDIVSARQLWVSVGWHPPQG
ncbi:MAG: HNH endonuclease signature motif containing protein [Caldilineaceae bacterium]